MTSLPAVMDAKQPSVPVVQKSRASWVCNAHPRTADVALALMIGNVEAQISGGAAADVASAVTTTNIVWTSTAIPGTVSAYSRM